jgi:putative FmdB family regulatory protein
MPIYEYLCGACGHQLEAFQKMTDEPLTECPVCHKPKLTKLISAAGFQLKGTGWYATDFKHKGKPEVKSDIKSNDVNKRDVDTETKTKSDNTAKSETKTKTDTKTDT